MSQIMGILNVTPDSFSDGDAYFHLEQAIVHAKQMERDGADIIDIGGESTRPRATPVPEEEELRRVIPVVEALAGELSTPISIDTYKPKVARHALQAGAQIVNDIAGCRDPGMRDVVAEAGCPVVVMHMPGTPQTMQDNPQYPEGVAPTLLKWFEQRVELLISSGIEKEQIILDPGIGFGKTVDHNLEILRALPKFKTLGLPLLIGASRKSFMRKIVQKPAHQLLSATVAVHTMALAAVDIIRVHDVGPHRDAVDLFSAIQG